MSEVIKTPHDAFFKAAFSDKHVARDFFSSYVPKEVLKHVDLDTLEPQKDSQVDEKLKEQFSDLIYKVDINGMEGYFYFLIEHKSYNDKLSVLQLLRYIVGIWESKVINEKEKRLPIIIPMLIYHDKDKWKAHMKLSDWIEGYDELSDEIKSYVPDYEYLLHDIGKYAKNKIVKDSRTSLAIDMLDKARYGSREEIKKLISEAVKVMMELKLKDESDAIIKAAIKYVLCTRGDFTTEEVSKIAGSISEEGSEFVMTVAEQLRQEGRQEGIQEGIQEGEIKGRKDSARELIKMGLSAQQIAQATKLTIEEVIELRKEISN